MARTERVATVEGGWIDETAVAEGTVEERVDGCHGGPRSFSTLYL